MSRVSIIMPCFNHGRFLSDSITSILEQTHADFELIVVDDCSTDDSWKIINRFAGADSRIKPIKHRVNQQLSRSRNDALEAAQNELIGFCDADDIWEHQKLERQIQFLRNNPEFGLVYCDTLIINEDGATTGQRFRDLFPPPQPACGWLFLPLLNTNFINIQSVLLRRECVEWVGAFDERIQWVQDWWYWIQLSRRYRFFYCAEPLARYRIHSRSTASTHAREYCKDRLKVMSRVLRQYGDVPKHLQAELIYRMGVDLCALGRERMGRRYWRRAIRMAMNHPRAVSSSSKALCRLVLGSRATVLAN